MQYFSLFYLNLLQEVILLRGNCKEENYLLILLNKYQTEIFFLSVRDPQYRGTI